MYTTIYCGANPSRAKEIWQYISVINTVASSYVWDNVYNYDVVFRHLMAFNPQRSWSITYNQMWNLSMCDPLPPRKRESSVMDRDQCFPQMSQWQTKIIVVQRKWGGEVKRAFIAGITIKALNADLHLAVNLSRDAATVTRGIMHCIIVLKSNTKKGKNC